MGKQLTPEQKRLYQRIDEILWEYWDPIGVNSSPEARDEYYGYLPEVFSLAQANASIQDIAKYLLQTEKERMGLAGDFKNCHRVAEMILDINKEI